jgi:hypothetical protein
VGDNAFSSCTSLRSITLPSSVRTLGDDVFAGCTSLTNARLSSGLKAIGNNVFQNCSSLVAVDISGSIRSIGGSAFSGCTALESMTLPGSVTNLGNNAFFGCSGLTHITMDSGVRGIGDYAFSGCTSLAGVTLPANITSTGNYTFQGCTSLISVAIPKGVTSIGDSAFFGCSNLASVSIPSTVTSIGANAFFDCTSLTAVVLPSSVASVGYEAFAGCAGLAGVYFTGNAPSLVDLDVFQGAANASVYYSALTAGWSSSLSDAPTVAVTKPLIIRSPASQTALAGTEVTLSVEAFGTRSTSYQWQFNGTNISGARSSTLTLSSVQSKNAGSYTAIVSDSYGSANSGTAVLSVDDIAGTYEGMIVATNAFDTNFSGKFVLTVTSGAKYSAKLTFPSQTTSGSGKLFLDADQSNAVAQFTNKIAGQDVEVLMSIALDSSTTVSGWLMVPGGDIALAQIEGDMVANVAKADAAAVYSVAVLPAATNQPAGEGYGSVVVSSAGVRIYLALPDEKAAATTLASDCLQNGSIPVFASLGSGKGFLSGWLTLTNSQIVSPSALAWHREAGAGSTSFAEGSNQWLSIYGPATNSSGAVGAVPATDSQPASRQ